MKIIKDVIDTYFDFMDEIGGNSFPEEFIPKLLINEEKISQYEGIRFWKAIESTIKEKEIQELENYYGHPLPDSYKWFLKYRHFIELQLGTYSINFFKNLPGTIVQDTKEEIESYYPMIRQNYLPFARLGDYGVLCFDANEQIVDHNYKVLNFDHEDFYSQSEVYAPNFGYIFAEFKAHLEDWMKNKRAKENTT